ncbi:MAG: hypothetical protein ACOYB3_01290 [Azonexus sp.]
MRYFFTADLHLWHKKILLLAGRPFDSIEEHNAAIQDHINAVVTPNDHLVILGDVAFGSDSRLSKWLDGLRTKKLHLVWGNHDGTAETLVKREPKRFQRVGDVLQFKLPWPGREKGVHVFCSHYAHRVWNKSHHGSYHLYGHSHGSLPDDPKARSMDVGVDTNRYGPWALEDIIDRLDKKEFNPVDHHKDLTGFSNKTICALCNIIKFYHQGSTLKCPRTVDQPGPGDFHPTQYFAPKLSS